MIDSFKQTIGLICLLELLLQTMCNVCFLFLVFFLFCFLSSVVWFFSPSSLLTLFSFSFFLSFCSQSFCLFSFCTNIFCKEKKKDQTAIVQTRETKPMDDVLFSFLFLFMDMKRKLMCFCISWTSRNESFL